MNKISADIARKREGGSGSDKETNLKNNFERYEIELINIFNCDAKIVKTK